MSELKPCPFCGKDAKAHSYAWEEDGMNGPFPYKWPRQSYKVQCTNDRCGAYLRNEWNPVTMNGPNQIEDVQERWNRRPRAKRKAVKK